VLPTESGISPTRCHPRRGYFASVSESVSASSTSTSTSTSSAHPCAQGARRQGNPRSRHHALAAVWAQPNRVSAAPRGTGRFHGAQRHLHRRNDVAVALGTQSRWPRPTSAMSALQYSMAVAAENRARNHTGAPLWTASVRSAYSAMTSAVLGWVTWRMRSVVWLLMGCPRTSERNLVQSLAGSQICRADYFFLRFQRPFDIKGCAGRRSRVPLFRTPGSLGG